MAATQKTRTRPSPPPSMILTSDDHRQSHHTMTKNTKKHFLLIALLTIFEQSNVFFSRCKWALLSSRSGWGLLMTYVRVCVCVCVCVHARDDAGLTCIDAWTMAILLAALVAPVWIPVHATTRFHPSSHSRAHVEKQHYDSTTQGTTTINNRKSIELLQKQPFE